VRLHRAAKTVLTGILGSEIVAIPALILAVWALYRIRPSEPFLLFVGGGAISAVAAFVYRREAKKLREGSER